MNCLDNKISVSFFFNLHDSPLSGDVNAYTFKHTQNQEAF